MDRVTDKQEFLVQVMINRDHSQRLGQQIINELGLRNGEFVKNPVIFYSRDEVEVFDWFYASAFDTLT